MSDEKRCCEPFVYEIQGEFYTDHGPTCDLHVRPSVERMRSIKSWTLPVGVSRDNLNAADYTTVVVSTVPTVPASEMEKWLAEYAKPGVVALVETAGLDEELEVMIDCIRVDAQGTLKAIHRKGYAIRKV